MCCVYVCRVVCVVSVDVDNYIIMSTGLYVLCL